MKAYKGTFIKKDGSKRNMFFARIPDILEVNSNFMTANTSGGRPQTVAEGSEVVFDLHEDNFRIFNWNTASNVIVENIEDDLFK